MRTSKTTVVFILALVITGAATARQLAMLVEVTPREVVKGGTLTEIVVRVAPEDRTALGKDVMLWVELTRTEARVLRKGWALKIDDPDEPLDVEIVIPDGPHVLRVDLKGAEGRSTGLWWGDVDVSSPASASASASESVPAQAAVGGAFMPRDPEATEPRVVNDPPTDGEVVEPDPDPVPDASDSQQRQRSAAATATAAAAATEPASEAEPDPDPVPVPDASDSQQRQRSAAATGTAAAAGTAAATGTEPDPDPVPVPDASDSQQRQRSAAATGTAAAAGTAAATGTEPASASALDGSQQRQQSATVAATEPVSASDFAPIETGDVSTECVPPPPPELPSRDELTVMVTRDGAPVSGLTADRFVVTAGGTTIPVSRVEGQREGVTNLRIAIDLDAATLADMGWISGLVERLAEMVNPRPGFNIVGNLAGRFSCPVRFDQANTESLGWMIEAEKAAPQKDLPHLIVTSLESANATRGKSFLVIVTDGRGPRNPKAWKGVYEAAAKSGVPVFIAGIWREDFGSGLRKDLRRLAAASGGAAFYVQGPSQVGDLIERFGADIDGAYSVVVESLEAAGKIEVAVVGVDADVRAATAIRWSKRRYDFEGDGIRGMFVYIADAANFTECTTGRQFPVAMEAEYLAAERSYLESRSGPWASLLMTIEGRVEIRHHPDRGFVNESIIIDRLIAVHPGEACE